MITAVVVVFVVPFLWSACLALLRRMPDFRSGPQYIDDKTEKRHLALMLLPVIVGLAVAVTARFVPLAFPLPLPVLPMAEVTEATGSSIAPVTAAAATPSVNWIHLALITTAIAYGAGLGIHLAGLSIGLFRLRHLAAHSKPAAEWGQGVRLTPAGMSPLALGRTTILIPEGLLPCLSQAQTQMILRHEREHLKRGDARWFVILAVIDAVFWFNPFVRHQTRACRLAAELACDAAVVAAAPEMRGTYAEALVRVLKHAAGDVRQYAPTAFSPEKSGDYRMRISEIMQPPARSRKPRLIVAAITAALLVPVGLAQFAWSQTLAPVAAEQPAATPAT
ncbi:MAG: M56 family metallopeptidase, partial [Asticcacaulis sp.]|nr:M56 family metallopeptidase [Asticcacaulis sp.]